MRTNAFLSRMRGPVHNAPSIAPNTSFCPYHRPHSGSRHRALERQQYDALVSRRRGGYCPCHTTYAGRRRAALFQAATNDTGPQPSAMHTKSHLRVSDLAVIPICCAFRFGSEPHMLRQKERTTCGRDTKTQQGTAVEILRESHCGLPFLHARSLTAQPFCRRTAPCQH